MIERTNRAFIEMLKPAIERLEKHKPEDIAWKANVKYDQEHAELLTKSLGQELHISCTTWQISPQVDEWQHLSILHYLDLADNTPVTGEICTMGETKDGLVRGGGFDRTCEFKIQQEIGNYDPAKLQKVCEDMGADIVQSNADLCAVFYFMPNYPVTLKIWFADDELPGSGRMFLDRSADHYLTIEDAVTVGDFILRGIIQKYKNAS
ncbi:MAG: DUF3786 domain-containing protein [Clostridia bacterium]|nr:DUF3786 domain-containing protein [Clostridia bacterium]NCC43345.1 DUF3786 domain-containing protein [Clostridia bacterium]